MPFDSKQRILKFTGAALYGAESLAAQYGSDAGGVKTLLSWNDREGRDELRPAQASVDFSPIALTDGTFVAMGFWSQAALNAVESGEVDGVEEITLEQFVSLTPNLEF